MFFSELNRSSLLAIEPSSFMISQMTPDGEYPASSARSQKLQYDRLLLEHHNPLLAVEKHDQVEQCLF